MEAGIDDFIKTIPSSRVTESPLKMHKVSINKDLEDVKSNKGNDDQSNPFARSRTEKVNRPSSAAGKLAYGTKKKAPTTLDQNENYEVVDRCHGLEKENLVLKEKENLLEREIIKMQTKLRRIEELMKSGKTYSDMDFARLQQELEAQFGDFKDENTVLKERVRKLHIIYKGLSNKGYEAKSKVYPNKTTYGKPMLKKPINNKVQPYIPGRTMQQPQHVQLVEELKLQLVKNEKEIIKLRAEKDRLNHSSSGHLTIDDLTRKIRERESEIKDIVNQYDEIQSNFLKKEQIYKETQAFIQRVSQSIGEQRINNQTISQKNVRLHITASQAKSLEQQLKDLEKETQELEISIRTITSEPFFNREKGQSALKRIAELEEKFIEKDKILKSVKDEEERKEKELKDLQPKVEQLRGERDHLQRENGKLKEKFTTTNNMDEFSVYKTLFQMDPTKYAQTMKDFSSSQQNAYPIWANIDFLERGNQEQVNPNDPKYLKLEIMKLRHENKDFAAELEKAQNLLQLQKDIDQDNYKYLEAEKQRLHLMSKSSQMKAEELARRADEKQRQLNEMSRKMGQTGALSSRSPSPQKYSNVNDIYETQSEFSVMTNESDIRTDENIMDFVIQDAEYYFDSFRQVLDDKELLLHQKTLITFVTADFYNHDTETSQIAEGFKPLYNTQFSFKNRVDDFYIQFMQKNSIKLDVYISKNNAAIHLGHAEIFLRKLIARETAVVDAAMKTPVIQQTIRLFGVRGDQPIGSIRFKMRMRRPISEAMRFYREKNEIANIRAQDTFIEGASRKKLITVQIVGCKDIKVKYSGISQIAPFFYYQFYTFDEKYSHTAVGENPIFEDTQNFEVQFDAKLIQYLQKEPLEVILFDDNAPITGVDRGSKSIMGEQVDDMIGTAVIPLGELIKGASVHERFPIRNNNKESVGLLEVKISIIDIDSGFTSLMSGKPQVTLHYNKQWENELIYRIAKRLARFPGDVEMLFGIFSRGHKNVTKEDFKYTVLKRLQLSKEISEREIDMFLRGCPQIVDKNVIDLEDFLMIFSALITQARHDILDEEANQNTTIRKFEDIQRQSQTLVNKQSTTNFGENDFARSQSNVFNQNLVQSTSRSNLTFNEQEIIDILAKCRAGDVQNMVNQMRTISAANLIDVVQFQFLLVQYGNISEFEANKVGSYFQIKSKVNLNKFEEYLKQSLHLMTITSAALQKFIDLIKINGEKLADRIVAQDLNKDGDIGLDGMIFVLMDPEFGFKKYEVEEIFQIVQKNGLFRYREFLILHNQSLSGRFGMYIRSTTPSIYKGETPGTTSRQEPASLPPRQDSLNESRHSLSMTSSYEDPKLRIIKNKLKNYIHTQDITLASLFKLIDTNSDQILTLAEFKQKMKALEIQLDDMELTHLFQILDKTNKGTINYQQFVSEFPEINMDLQIPIQLVFEDYCSDKNKKIIDAQDFKRFIKKYIDKAAEHEIDSLFRHFTEDKLQYVTFEQFKNAFGKEVKDQVFKISIEDIIKPLATKVKAYNVNISQLFDKYDANKNGKLSAEELARAIQKDMNLTLFEDEIREIRQYFKDNHRTYEISKLDFIALLQMKFARDFKAEDAKTSLQTIKLKLSNTNRTALSVLSPFDLEKNRRLTLRNFKWALNELKCLSLYEINNMTRFLDKEDDGFITIEEFDVAVRGTHVNMGGSGNSFNQSMGASRTNKWNKK